MIERPGRTPDERCLQRWAVDHLASGDETARANDIATVLEFFDHRVEPRCVVVVISRENQHSGGLTLGKPCDYRTECAATAVLYANDLHTHRLQGSERGQRVVVVVIVTNEDSERRTHVVAQRLQHAPNASTFVVNRNDDV